MSPRHDTIIHDRGVACAPRAYRRPELPHDPQEHGRLLATRTRCRDLRDNAAHLLVPEVVGIASRYFQAGLRNYIDHFTAFVQEQPFRFAGTGLLTLGLPYSSPTLESLRTKHGRDAADIKALIVMLENSATNEDPKFVIPMKCELVLEKKPEGPDSVHVVVPRRVVQPGVIRLSAEADQRFQLTQRERIALAMLALGDGLSAVELAAKLELPDPGALKVWTGRLLELGLVVTTGRTRAMRYFVPPTLLRAAGLDQHTTLTRVQPHRLVALVLEDLDHYPDSAVSDIHRRIGREIPARTVKRTVDRLVAEGRIQATGKNRWRRYRAAPSIDHGGDGGR